MARGPYSYRNGNRDEMTLKLEGAALLTSWATPAAHEAGGTPAQFLARKAKAKAKGANLGESLTSLSMQALTPIASDARGPSMARIGGGVEVEAATLGDVARAGDRDPWRDVEWLPCLDGSARPVEPGLEPLAHGVSGRVAVRRAVEQADASVQIEEHWYNRPGALAGFGNAIVPELGAVFIEAAIAASEALK